MDRVAGMLILVTVGGADSIGVSRATPDGVAKLDVSGGVSGWQPWSKTTATNNSASRLRNDLFIFCTRLSWMMWLICTGDLVREEAGFLSAPGNRAIAFGRKHIFEG